MKIQIKSRLLATVQSKGNLGKSTECLARIEWLKNLSVEWQAYDLDDAHRSVFSATRSALSSFRFLARKARSNCCASSAMPGKRQFRSWTHAPRQRTKILRVIQRTQFLSIAADQGIRMTVFVFPYDDLATMQNLEGVVRELGNAVDYVVVRNPAKNPTRMFDGSGLQSIIKEWGGAEITMPAMFKSTLLQLDELEARHERGITWAEAIGNRDLKLDVFARGDLESFLTDMHAQYDAIAGHLLPTDMAAKVQPKKQATPSTAKADFQSRLNFNWD